MIRDVCLCAPTEAELKAALPFAVRGEDEVHKGEVIAAAGDWVTDRPGEYSLDLIGPLTIADAVRAPFDEATGRCGVAAPPQVNPGFHANLRLVGTFAPEIPSEVIVTPATPRRTWA